MTSKKKLDAIIKWWKLLPKHIRPIHREIMLKSLQKLKRELKG